MSFIVYMHTTPNNKRYVGITQKEAVEARNKFIEDNNLPHRKNIYTGEKQNG